MENIYNFLFLVSFFLCFGPIIKSKEFVPMFETRSARVYFLAYKKDVHLIHRELYHALYFPVACYEIRSK